MVLNIYFLIVGALALQKVSQVAVSSVALLIWCQDPAVLREELAWSCYLAEEESLHCKGSQALH